MRKIIARCREAKGCPLYRSGDQFEFVNLAAQGIDSAPVCMRAVAAFGPNVNMIRAGDLPENHERTFCGGCEAGLAWFDFATETAATIARMSPEFETFALNALAKMKLFSGTTASALEKVVPFMRERRMAPDEIVMRRGEPGEALYIIVSGKFDVVNFDDQNVEHLIATLAPGDCFGEMSLITGEAVSANVVSREVGRLLAIPKSEFPKLLSIVPSMGLTLARMLAQRLAKSSNQVMDELKKGMVGRLDMVSPAELIQAMNVNSQTGMLVIQGEKVTSTLFVQDGQIHDVKTGTQSGEEALYEFLKWKKGNFHFEVGKKTSARTIHQDTVGLLLEGMRRIDEANQPKEQPAGIPEQA